MRTFDRKFNRLPQSDLPSHPIKHFTHQRCLSPGPQAVIRDICLHLISICYRWAAEGFRHYLSPEERRCWPPWRIQLHERAERGFRKFKNPYWFWCSRWMEICGESSKTSTLEVSSNSFSAIISQPTCVSMCQIDSKCVVLFKPRRRFLYFFFLLMHLYTEENTPHKLSTLERETIKWNYCVRWNFSCQGRAERKTEVW